MTRDWLQSIRRASPFPIDDIYRIRALMLILIIWGETHKPDRSQPRIIWLKRQVKDVRRLQQIQDVVNMILMHAMRFWDVIAELGVMRDHRGEETQLSGLRGDTTMEVEDVADVH